MIQRRITTGDENQGRLPFSHEAQYELAAVAKFKNQFAIIARLDHHCQHTDQLE